MPGRAKYAVYVYDIPVDILQQICTTLDNDKGWRALAAKCGFNMDEVSSFSLEYYRHHGSPTERLIGDWGVRNPTIQDLHEKLRTIGRIREMKLLEPLLQASKEHERQERARREAEEQEAKEREAKEKEAKEKEAKEQEAKALKVKEQKAKEQEAKAKESEGACNFDKKLDKSKPMLAEPLQVAGPLTASNGKPAVQYESLNHVDREKHNYEELNLDDDSHKAKASQKKKLGVELQETKAVHRKYPKMDSAKLNQSDAENCPKDSTNSDPPQSSLDKELAIHMSEDEIASAKSLTYSPAGQLAKDLVVAVSATAKFTYKDLSCATNGFADGSKIGEGGFGDVYLGVLKNSKCAVKRLRQTEMWKASKEQMDHHVSEIKSLMLYRHENIVQLYGFAVDGDEICLVYQYMENGSLEDRLQCKDDTRPLTWSQRITILCGGARGIQYLHTMDHGHPLIHGDIKSANILLDKHFEAKISDFGLAEYANAGQKTGMFTHVSRKDVKQKNYGSRAYLPPEFFSNGPSTKSDTYGFGVIILETCTGEKAFDEKRESDECLGPYMCTLMEEQPQEEWPKYLDQRAGPPPNHIQPLLILAQKCISDRKKDRPIMTDALKQLEWIAAKWKDDSFIPATGEDVFPEEFHPAWSPASESGGHSSPLSNAFHQEHVASGHATRSNLPRMASLPCTATPPWLVTKRLAKSHSLDEEPESLRLQRMYDMNRYQNELKKLGQVLANEGGPPVEEEPYPSNPDKLAEMQQFDEPNSFDSNSSGKTLTEISVEQNLTSADNPGGSDMPPLSEDGSDLAKVQAMQEFDDEQTASNISHNTDDELHKKVEDMRLTPNPHLPQAPGADEQARKMAEFFGMYEAELESLNHDEPLPDSSVQGQPGQGQGQVVDPANQETVDVTQGMVFCGYNTMDGQQMAILMDPKSNQYYAVDPAHPALIDPVQYHHQQLSYYMQCQSEPELSDSHQPPQP